MSWIDELFGGGRAAAAGAMSDELNQGLQSMSGLFNRGVGFLNPFMSREQGLYGDLMSRLNEEQDPVAFYNKIASQYKMTPEAQAQIKVGQAGANNAATAAGMLGSGAAQTAAANLAQSVRSQDFDKYMANALGINSQYLSGIGSLQNQGFQAATHGADLMAQEAQDQEKYYEGIAGANAAGQEAQAGGLDKMIGDIGSLFTGGWSGLLGNLFNQGSNPGSSWLNPDTGRFGP